MELECDCGHVARGDDESDLIDDVQAHAWRAHHVELPRELVHELALRAAGEGGTATRRSEA